MTPFTPRAQVAYDTYAKTRGRGGDQNDGPAWEAVATAVIEAYKESIKPWFHVDYSKRPEPVILRRMTDEESLEHRKKFAASLRQVYDRFFESRFGFREADYPFLIYEGAWLAVAEKAEEEFAPDGSDDEQL